MQTKTRAVVGLGIVAVLGYLRMRGSHDVVRPVFAASAISGRSAGSVPSIAVARPIRVAPPDRPVLTAEDPQLFDLEPSSLEIGPTLALPPRTLYGRLVDENGEPSIGATVVASSPNLAHGEMVVITDENGDYRMPEAPPGSYVVTIYYNNQMFEHELSVDDGGPTHYDDVLVNGMAPEPFTNEQGVTITTEYTEVPGRRTFGEVLGAVTGEPGDLYGTTLPPGAPEHGVTIAPVVEVVAIQDVAPTQFGNAPDDEVHDVLVEDPSGPSRANIPVGRTFEVVMGAAAGEQIDAYGTPVDPSPRTFNRPLETPSDN